MRSARSGSPPARTAWRGGARRWRRRLHARGGDQAAADRARAAVHRPGPGAPHRARRRPLPLLYFPFMIGWTIPLGAVTNVVAHIRFNSPISGRWRGRSRRRAPPPSRCSRPGGGGVGAVEAADATSLRLGMADGHGGRLRAGDLSVVSALLHAVPGSAATLPLTVWTYTIVPVYLVWDWSRYGGRWRVPDWLMVIEYRLVVVARSRAGGPDATGVPRSEPAHIRRSYLHG